MIKLDVAVCEHDGPAGPFRRVGDRESVLVAEALAQKNVVGSLVVHPARGRWRPKLILDDDDDAV